MSSDTRFDHARIEQLPRSNSEPCGHNHSLENPISPDGTPVLGKRYEVAARGGALVGNKFGTFSRPTESEALQSRQDGVGEGVVDHREIDIVVR